jgi:hypothetical protein
MKIIISENQLGLIRRISEIEMLMGPTMDEVYEYLQGSDPSPLEKRLYGPFESTVVMKLANQLANKTRLIGDEKVTLRNQLQRYITNEYYTKIRDYFMSRLTQDVSEQMGVMDVLASMPETGQEVTGMVGSSTSPCEVSKTSSEMVLELFGKARGLSGQPSQTDSKIQNWVTRISKSIAGAGITDDFRKVMSEIKTAPELGSVLNAYNKKFGRKLYDDLKSEYTISWDTVRSYVKKFDKAVNLGWCKKFKQVTSMG